MNWVLKAAKKGIRPLLREGTIRVRGTLSQLPMLQKYVAEPTEEELEFINAEPAPEPAPIGPRIGFHDNFLELRVRDAERAPADLLSPENDSPEQLARNAWLKTYRTGTPKRQLCMELGIDEGTDAFKKAIERHTLTEQTPNKSAGADDSLLGRIEHDLKVNAGKKGRALLFARNGHVYAVEKQLGRGGMGAAYIADGVNEELHVPGLVREAVERALRTRGAKPWSHNALQALLQGNATIVGPYTPELQDAL
ncbi:MAG: hypothetical protein AABY13_04245, partial [Nanoarchaeota archaeon]